MNEEQEEIKEVEVVKKGRGIKNNSSLINNKIINMKKTIMVSGISLVIGALITFLVISIVNLNSLRNTVITDHATLTQIVTFLNDSIAKSQPATAGTSATSAAPTKTK